ncbi:MAG: hypothetical protein EXR36_01710 [Betaproteobacteria bacterium]|nr:hypothetical protein [Betaproteobacteria bacterium]
MPKKEASAKAVVRPAAAVMWEEPPEHYGGAYSIYNTGMTDLPFIVVTSPPDHEPKQRKE